jgi:hypothetical protein
MSTHVGIALLALVAGLAGGAAAVVLRQARRPPRSPEDTLAATRIQGQLEAQAAEMRRLADATASRDLAGEQLRSGLEGARRSLELMELRERERRDADAEHREVVRRLSTVLAGGASRGRAGENILRDQLAQLPPGLLVTDLRVGGKVVEFGLCLPDGRRLPIDSKWTALIELQALEEAEEGLDRDACARAVERAVVARAREVAQYLDPAVTAPVAVAAVPDAAYEVLKRAHADAWAHGVVIVPYASALPIILFLYSIVERFGGEADVRSGLAEVAAVLDALEAVVENKFARAGVMIANGADEFRSQLGSARGSIARARAVAATSEGTAPVLALDDGDGALSAAR